MVNNEIVFTDDYADELKSPNCGFGLYSPNETQVLVTEVIVEQLTNTIQEFAKESEAEKIKQTKSKEVTKQESEQQVIIL